MLHTGMNDNYSQNQGIWRAEGFLLCCQILAENGLHFNDFFSSDTFVPGLKTE